MVPLPAPAPPHPCFYFFVIAVFPHFNFFHLQNALGAWGGGGGGTHLAVMLIQLFPLCRKLAVAVMLGITVAVPGIQLSLVLQGRCLPPRPLPGPLL